VARARSAATVIVGALLALGLCATSARALEAPVDATLGLPAADSSLNGRVPLVALGRALFQDKQLSRDGSVSCATCHDPSQAFADARKVSLGVGGSRGTRNVPSLINVVYAQTLFWDGRRSMLESQVADPFTNSREHGLASQADLVARVVARDDYLKLLAAAFENQRADWQSRHLFEGLASYLRTLRAGGSPFDRFYFGLDKTALDEPARRGLDVFRGPAACSQCHSIGADGALFSDNKFHGGSGGTQQIVAQLSQLTQRSLSLSPEKIGEVVTGDPELAALGRFLVTKNPQDIAKYKTPSLRNVALTAPYMHDGGTATLREAVDYEIYYRSIELGRPLLVTPAERDDLMAFLRSLTSPCVEQLTCPGM
jgi:cytochrome c peroxidase